MGRWTSRSGGGAWIPPRTCGCARPTRASDYYHGLQVGYGVNTASGDFVEIVDLGLFDWVEEVTSNRRHRFVASAIGIQLLALLFTEARRS